MYTFSRSFGSSTRVFVCEPRHVWTVVMYLGFERSEMSMMRMPRARSLLTVSCTPCSPQSTRPLVASAETKSRLRYTVTSLCEPGHTYAVRSVGRLGFEMSQTCQP